MYNIRPTFRTFLVSRSNITGQFLLHTFEIDSATPFRFCTDSIDRRCRIESGDFETFRSRNITFTFGVTSGYITSNMSITIDNVDLAMSEVFDELRQSANSHHLIYRVYLTTNLGSMSASAIKLPIDSCTINQSAVSFTSNQAYIASTNLPDKVYSEDLFPNLVAGLN